ncbi:hypothetical protein DL237_19260 [Pseudooceanicola sediminis]|uniref:Uncharacterized protein n=1 Tax=Pseudooceanicola sediminis TaxID=2211117 RepID=A0A399IVU5_9RHOB|nr:hypothetical protein [Pseudooceanicola sediminis]KAA2311560.1 hypothetical protein E0K93_20135 [Puniceibacterium sp. HSS470]RII37070.1 hypothetical protein DL237_19260 [Pseudooceanicola sediminis]
MVVDHEKAIVGDRQLVHREIAVRRSQKVAAAFPDIRQEGCDVDEAFDGRVNTGFGNDHAGIEMSHEQPDPPCTSRLLWTAAISSSTDVIGS